MTGDAGAAVNDLDAEPAGAASAEDDKGAAAAAEDAAAGDEGADDAELNDITVDVQRGNETVRMAPVKTIVAHRQAARAAKTAAATEKARADQLEAQLNELGGKVEKIAPMLKAMHARPDLVEQAMKGTRPSTVDHPDNTEPDAEMVELAKSLELYDADGKPDAARAARISGVFEKKADKKAEARVAPILNAEVEKQASANKAQLYQWAKDGHVSKEGVDKAIALLPGAEQLLAHTGVRDVLYFMAKGMSPAKAAAAAGVSDDVLHVESAGGRGKAPTELPNFSKHIAARRGKTPSEWAKVRDISGDVLE